MRLAALYDIHANLAALDAVLDEVRAADVDRIIIGGDVLPGPMSRETLLRLLDLDVPVQFIQGNCEVAVLAARAGADPGRMPPDARAVVEWTARHLDDAHAALLESWPKTLRVVVPGIGDVLFCHGTPRHENEIMLRDTDAARLLPILEGLRVPLVVCGHTHMQYDRMVGATRVVNAGSVGMPFGHTGADWLLLGPGVELRHTAYDLAVAAAQIARNEHPETRRQCEDWILHPPDADEMNALYRRAELQHFR
jgi:putative phosphoesterase